MSDVKANYTKLVRAQETILIALGSRLVDAVLALETGIAWPKLDDAYKLAREFQRVERGE